MQEDAPPPPAPVKPSQIPSWVTLGFVLGALFVLALPRRAAVEPAPRPAAVESAPKAPEPPQIATIEAVFEAWGQYAVWSDDTTEVALWDPGTKRFSDCYEVMKVGEARYFRSIPMLTRPLLTHGVVTESPLQFTETERQRQEWLGEVRKESWKAITEGARDSLGPVAPKPADGK